MKLEKLIKQCCVCKDYSFPDFPGYWIEADKATRLDIESKHLITHSYCPPCAKVELNKILYYRLFGVHYE